MRMTKAEIIEQLQALEEGFEDEYDAVPICISEAIRYLTEQKVVAVIEGTLAREVSLQDAMDLVWSDVNTEKTPLHLYDALGNEIEW